MKTSIICSKIFMALTFSFCIINKANAVVDIGATTIVSPETGFGLSIEPIVITIENFGDEPISDFGAYFIIDGSTVYGETVAAVLEPGETMEYTFSAVVDFSPLGPYYVCAWTYIGGDIYSSNDSTCTTIISLKLVDLAEAGTVFCDSAILNAENVGVDYLWNTGDTTQTITAYENGIYWVVVTEPISGVSDTDTIEVSIEVMPIASFIYSAIGLNSFEFINTSSGIGTCHWDFGTGAESFEINPSYDYYVNGFYTVTLTVTNFCGSNSYSMVIMAGEIAIDSIEMILQSISLYPNPATDKIIIENEYLNNEIKTIKTFSITGRGINTTESILSNRKIELNITSVTPGVYFCQIETEAGILNLQWIKQ
ncbi:MAG: T9SS type A sorting domain-containing protein [Fimbriimonadaceae bacterium]|nr:T9SS type A sorting domain-containing protein [Chitinophagales bacterium]